VLSGPAEALLTLPNTYLGPIFQMKTGQTVRAHFTNELPQESIVHRHGLPVPVEADGHPRLAIAPGETYIYNFTVADRAGTYWHHPHPHGRTGPQAFYGLAGLFIISDDEEQALGLPSGGFVDEGWHDTVLVMPGERVKVLQRFEDFEGLYLYHCHNLEHEDMGMMRNYRVEA